ncbi:hypothetical protein CLMAG_06740 [Clostridium magnum DSM 2767]|uniref:Uncharacterized protein n=1 Tax=Clostridium magnum DSM 2767 TaxID=1121326 RepID=A0A161X2A8_9CLOT|nr:hypothetical protein CLMAG_06740 [Clostridium magnum DSM 2767]SHI57124.1 hypothetical protein SAMN02745944_04503 [Clostridium magnum DSM 2767]
MKTNKVKKNILRISASCPSLKCSFVVRDRYQTDFMYQISIKKIPIENDLLCI